MHFKFVQFVRSNVSIRDRILRLLSTSSPWSDHHSHSSLYDPRGHAQDNPRVGVSLSKLQWEVGSKWDPYQVIQRVSPADCCRLVQCQDSRHACPGLFRL